MDNAYCDGLLAANLMSAAASSGRHPDSCAPAEKLKRRMRRVHIPLRFSTLLQRLESKGHAGSAWDSYKLGLQSSRNVSTKSVPPRIVFSGIQPTGIPHVRVFLLPVVYGHVDPSASSAITLGRLQTGSSCSLLLCRETSSFSPSSAGMPSPCPKTPNSSQRRGRP
jgi:hypothetical protein